MIGRFRRRATAEERRFDAALAELLAGRTPVSVPVEFGDDLIMAQELTRHLAPASELPSPVAGRLREKIADGVAVQERRSFWQRTFVARPVRLAATTALLVALVVAGVLSPLGSHARAAASDLWDGIQGSSSGAVQDGTTRTNPDGSTTVLDADGNEVVTLPPVEGEVTSGEVSSDDPNLPTPDANGITTVEIVP